LNLAGISFALIICSNLRSSQQGNLRAACYSLTISRVRVWARRQLLRGANKGSLCVACKPEGHCRGEVQMDELDRRQRRHPQTPAGERTELTFGQVQPRDLTQQRIRPGSFRAPQELVTAIKTYIENHNQKPQIFVWSAPMERILNKIVRIPTQLGFVPVSSVGFSHNRPTSAEDNQKALLLGCPPISPFGGRGSW